MLAQLARPSDLQPPVYVTRQDYDRLSALAGAPVDPPPGAALLQEELGRAVIVEAGEAPSGFVQLNSTVQYNDLTTRRVRTVEIVLPHEADMSRNRVSVFSPVGAALLGLTTGQEFVWRTPVGKPHRLYVLEVRHGANA